MYGEAAEHGRLKAAANFRAHKKRLYEIHLVPENEEQDGKSKFTGRRDGPFEIWTYPCYPILGHPHQVASETFIEFHNKCMRRLQEKTYN